MHKILITGGAGFIGSNLTEYFLDKARQLLGYEPTHAIREGLQEAVKWYKENL